MNLRPEELPFNHKFKLYNNKKTAWSLKQKNDFIQGLLSGLPFPLVYCYEQDYEIYPINNNQQILALQEFYAGSFEIFPIAISNKQGSFTSLSKEDQFKLTQPISIMVGKINEDEYKFLHTFVNNSDQTAQPFSYGIKI